jgi:hypothetical protein
LRSLKTETESEAATMRSLKAEAEAETEVAAMRSLKAEC